MPLGPTSPPVRRVARAWTLPLSVLVFTACATTASEPSANHPANPSAPRGPATPPFTTLAGNDLPEVEPAGDEGTMHADGRGEDGMAGMHHHEHATGSAEPAPDAAAPTPDAAMPADAEHMAFENAQPVFERFCAPCHATRGARHSTTAMHHFNLDTYPVGGHHAATAGETVREVLGVRGEPASMPLDHPGAVQGEDLARVLAWADAFDRAHGGAAAAPDDDHDDHDDHDGHDEHDHDHHGHHDHGHSTPRGGH